MAEYEKYLDESEHPQEIVALAKEILRLRRLLWLSHGHKGIYGDDGEMQCGECVHEYGFYDWKRTSIGEIESKIQKANLKKLAKEKITNGETHLKCNKEFHTALHTLKDKMADIDFATDVYRALCNIQWQKKDTDYFYSCSLRYAGELVAKIRDIGESYLDFYISGGEGFVSDEIKYLLDDLGWISVPWKDEGLAAFLDKGENGDKDL